MYQVEAIANYFIKRGILEGNPVNPMKLQKLLYYAQGWYMGYFGEKLFNETIQAWKYGPVIEKIYHEVKAYGNYPITSCIESIVEDKPRSLSGFFSSMGIAEFKPKTPVDDQFMETTWQGLGNKDAIALSVATHEEGTPWDTVAKKYNYILPKGVVIEDDIIQNYFKTRIGK